jgi:hypothetical protein
MKEDKIGGTYGIHGMMRNAYSISVAELGGKDYLADLGKEKRLIFKWV